MVPYRNTGNSTYTLTDEDYTFAAFHIPCVEDVRFTEDKECNEGERVLCKGTSTRRELKKLPNRTGYKARKEFWK